MRKSNRHPSNMKHQFSEIPKVGINRSKFDRSHIYKTTFNEGLLIPFFFDECYPGDTMNLRTHALCRLNTPIFPLMDNAYVKTYYFSIPFRQVWENWQKCMGEQDNPGDTIDFLIPQVQQTVAPAEESLQDYFGIPLIANIEYSALFQRAYYKVWNEWFRHQDLQNSLVWSNGDGPDAPFELQRVNKQHDYFTSALPFPQKGEAVTIPIAQYADIIGTGQIGGNGAPLFNVGDEVGTGLTNAFDGFSPGVEYEGSPNAGVDPAEWNDPSLILDPAGGTPLQADLTTSTATSVNSMRTAFQVQRILEKDARGGTRYPEIIRSHFGVTDPQHAVLQRTEFLGGGTTPIVISPIAQTSIAGGESPLATLAAIGTAGISGHGFVKSFTEHCIVIGVLCVKADLTYQQGLDRMFSRKTRHDHFFPSFQHLGEQAILNKEIFAQGDPVADDDVFGYQERFAEMRYKKSLITGKFRSSAAQSLDAWHLSQDFADLPTLSSAFMEENAPFDRVVAVPSEPTFKIDIYNKYICARPMSTHGVPGYIDRF